jgi:hypothetical protein
MCPSGFCWLGKLRQILSIDSWKLAPTYSKEAWGLFPQLQGSVEYFLETIRQKLEKTLGSWRCEFHTCHLPAIWTQRRDSLSLSLTSVTCSVIVQLKVAMFAKALS